MPRSVRVLMKCAFVAMSPNDEIVAMPNFDMFCIMRTPALMPAKSAPKNTGRPAPLARVEPSSSRN